MKKLLSILTTAITVMSLMSFAVCADNTSYPETITVMMEVTNEDGTVEVQETYMQFLGLGYINADGVNLRSGPSTSYASLGSMYKNDTVGVYATEKTDANWVYVSVTSGNCKGKKGYAYSSYVTVSSPASFEDIVKE